MHAARIVSELQLMTSQPWLMSRAARPMHSPPRHARQQEVWYGHFGWAVHDGQRGAFCGAGANPNPNPYPYPYPNPDPNGQLAGAAAPELVRVKP